MHVWPLISSLGGPLDRISGMIDAVPFKVDVCKTKHNTHHDVQVLSMRANTCCWNNEECLEPPLCSCPRERSKRGGMFSRQPETAHLEQLLPWPWALAEHTCATSIKATTTTVRMQGLHCAQTVLKIFRPPGGCTAWEEPSWHNRQQEPSLAASWQHSASGQRHTCLLLVLSSRANELRCCIVGAT
jgi:hypothetical protein